MIPTSILIMAGLATLALWNMPDALRSAAAHIMARAESIEAKRTAYAAGLSHWKTKLRVNEGE